MSATRSTGPNDDDGTNDDDMAQIAEGVHAGTKGLRNAAHWARNQKGCPARRLVPSLPECDAVGCTDARTEVYAVVLEKIVPDLHKRRARGEQVVVVALATVIARNVATDLGYSRRGAIGAVQKPNARTGVPERVRDELGCRFLEDVFVRMLFVAGDPGRHGREWPLDSWRELPRRGCTHEHGSIRSAVSLVLNVVRDVAGPAWLARCLADPMAAKTAVSCDADPTVVALAEARKELEVDASASLKAVFDYLVVVYGEQRTKGRAPREAVLQAIAILEGKRGWAAAKLTRKMLKTIAEDLEASWKLQGGESDIEQHAHQIHGLLPQPGGPQGRAARTNPTVGVSLGGI